MPEGYERMKRKFQMNDGLSEEEATKKAARIWNSGHKGGQTVGRGRD